MYHILKQITAPFSFFFLLMSIGFFCLFFYGDNYFVDVYLFITWTLFYTGSTNWLCLMVSKKYRKHYPLKDMNASIEWVVVLGGGEPATKTGTHADYLISDTSMRRLLEGIRVYRKLPLAKLLLSGGGKNKNSLESVAEKMKYIAMGLGVPEQAIIVETHSKNTKEEAAYIKDIVKENPFYLVTSSTHMQRAVAIFRDKGLSPLAATSDLPIHITKHNLTSFHLNPFVWEFLKTTEYELLGRAKEYWLSKLSSTRPELGK